MQKRQQTMQDCFRTKDTAHTVVDRLWRASQLRNCSGPERGERQQYVIHNLSLHLGTHTFDTRIEQRKQYGGTQHVPNCLTTMTY